MAWLHTWSGLLLSWLLFVMFTCGTAAYFQDEITRWMQPEVTTDAAPAAAADAAARWLQVNAPGASRWYITLPGTRSATTQLFWTPAPDAAPGSRRKAVIDGKGQEVSARASAGGYFLYRFHFDLHYIPVLWARYIVGVAAMSMLIAIFSGIVTHKKIFADFFMLRLGKGQRSWLDAHNVTAVLALPFYLMITYTGLVSLDRQYVPAPIAAAYPEPDAFYDESFPQGADAEATGTPAPLASLASMVVTADRHWGGAGVGYAYVANPGDAAARVVLTRAPSASMDSNGETLQFDGASGRLLWVAPGAGAAQRTRGVMIGLHAGRYAGVALRWLYFLSGLGGTIMVGTGLILWTVKRRSKLPDPTRPHLGFRIVERLNIAVILGFPIGIAGYFLANRLLPLGIAGRADWEVNSLFLTWGAMLLVALIRPPRRAWIELSAFAALLFAAIPLVSALATDRSLVASLLSRDWTFVGFELTMMAIALAFALASRKMAASQAVAGQRPHRVKRSHHGEARA